MSNYLKKQQFYISKTYFNFIFRKKFQKCILHSSIKNYVIKQQLIEKIKKVGDASHTRHYSETVVE